MAPLNGQTFGETPPSKRNQGSSDFIFRNAWSFSRL